MSFPSRGSSRVTIFLSCISIYKNNCPIWAIVYRKYPREQVQFPSTGSRGKHSQSPDHDYEFRNYERGNL